jgi:hypothetical protein
VILEGLNMEKFELDEETSKELELIKFEILDLSIRVATLSNKIKNKISEEINKKYEKSYGFNVGDSVIWRGIKSKLISYADGIPNVSVFVSDVAVSSVIHRVKNIKEISEWKS